MTFGIGFIALTWIVVNDAIILIDKINVSLGRKWDDKIVWTYDEIIDTIVVASKSRLQPVIVTTLTTVFGLLPLALQDPFWAGLGYTVIFGLMVGSTMTLFAIPVLYRLSMIRKKKYERELSIKDSKHMSANWRKNTLKSIFTRKQKVKKVIPAEAESLHNDWITQNDIVNEWFEKEENFDVKRSEQSLENDTSIEDLKQENKSLDDLYRENKQNV